MKSLVISASLALVFPTLAWAGPLAPGSISGSIEVVTGKDAENDVLVNFSGAGPSNSASASDGKSFATSSVDVSTTGFRGMTVGGAFLGGQGETVLGGAAQAHMSYQFMITGGATSSFVPISLHELGGITHSAFAPNELFLAGDLDSEARAIMRVLDPSGTELHYAQLETFFDNDSDNGNISFTTGGGTGGKQPLGAVDGVFPALNQTFDGVVTLDNPDFNELMTNTVYTVTLDFDYLDIVDANFDASGLSSSYSASLAAAIGFADGFDSNGYAISFSDGFGPDIVGGNGGNGGNGGGAGGNPGGVPEPATWALFIAGFGLLGAKLRQSRTPFAQA